jgi:hypothetical protein
MKDFLKQLSIAIDFHIQYTDQMIGDQMIDHQEDVYRITEWAQFIFNLKKLRQKIEDGKTIHQFEVDVYGKTLVDLFNSIQEHEE